MPSRLVLGSMAMIAFAGASLSACGLVFGPGLKQCKHFESMVDEATWSECPDKITRKIVCGPSGDSLACKCFEDGLETTSYNGKDMPLVDPAAAMRIATRNCRWHE